MNTKDKSKIVKLSRVREKAHTREGDAAAHGSPSGLPWASGKDKECGGATTSLVRSCK